MFRSTPPCGGDCCRGSLGRCRLTFRSTPPCGGDLVAGTEAHPIWVSIHAPVWGRRRRHGSHRCASEGFDPRPRVGATLDAIAPAGWFGSFDPRPRVGATQLFRPIEWRAIVSIHAPVWGRRCSARRPCAQPRFDPRPRVGATRVQRSCPPLRCVSIHAPVWGRLLLCCVPHILAGVSIHAPVWGRHRVSVVTAESLWFRSTPPCGGDGPESATPAAILEFRSTPPCGGDCTPAPARPCRSSFDPRPRVGATIGTSSLPVAIDVSIHAPVWGRLRQRARVFQPAHVSIHAPVWGRHRLKIGHEIFSGFRSTPPCGGDYRPRQ